MPRSNEDLATELEALREYVRELQATKNSLMLERTELQGKLDDEKAITRALVRRVSELERAQTPEQRQCSNCQEFATALYCSRCQG